LFRLQASAQIRSPAFCAHPSRLPSAVANAVAATPPVGNNSRELAVANSADHVQVAASAKSGSNQDEIILTIKVEDKFHINANPASFDFPIPTSVDFQGVKPTNVEYPKPIRFTAKFALEGLDVYEGSIVVVAKFPKGGLQGMNSVQGAVTVQACTEQICLPPSTLPTATTLSQR
jgi:hypothetical protein